MYDDYGTNTSTTSQYKAIYTSNNAVDITYIYIYTIGYMNTTIATQHTDYAIGVYGHDYEYDRNRFTWIVPRLIY